MMVRRPPQHGFTERSRGWIEGANYSLLTVGDMTNLSDHLQPLAAKWMCVSFSLGIFHATQPAMASPPLSSSSQQLAPDPPRLPRIPLAHKRVPTEMRAPHEHAQLLGAALVGSVDIAALRAELLALPESYWGEAHNRVHNVHFQRPFHDKLGVGNIMCVFSDTQLESVFTLPLYAHYRHHLARVFAAIDVHPDQVGYCSRSLLPAL